MLPFRLPHDDEHCLIVGKNGGGKSHSAVWQFSLRSYNIRPWIIIDIKEDEFIAEIEATPMGVRDRIPKEPGMYVVRVSPSQIPLLDDLFMRVWERQGVGVMVDEGYAIGARNEGYRALLMQGRSRLCPTITLSQRPVYLDRYAVSEPSHYQVFKLSDNRDWSTISEFTPIRPDPQYGKARYFSQWYNGKDDCLYRMAPAPDRDTILETFEQRRPRKKERWM